MRTDIVNRTIDYSTGAFVIVECTLIFECTAGLYRHCCAAPVVKDCPHIHVPRILRPVVEEIVHCQRSVVIEDRTCTACIVCEIKVLKTTQVLNGTPVGKGLVVV